MEKNSVHSTDRIGTDRIGKLLFDFSVPAIIGMLVNAIYNIVDRIYVGQGVDPLGIAGISLVMPVMMVLMASSMLIGIGANSLFSIRLGQGRKDEVEKIMGHAFALLFFVPGIVIVVCLIFLDDILLNILGVSAAVFPYAKGYLQVILYGGIFSAMGPGINHFIRSDGHPKTSMFTQILGAVVNIILDPIFIFVFRWGVAGAAWATIISQFISFIWVIGYFNSRFTMLRFRFRAMKLELKTTLQILAIGFAPFAMQLAIGLVNILLNRTLFAYGGDIAVAAMGIVYSILIVIIMPLQGLNQGAQPIIGYNYGAKKYDRVKKTYKWAVIYATAFVCAGFILFQFFPHFFIALFRNEEGELMDIGTFALWRCTMFLPLIGFQILSSNFFQSIGKPVQGTVLSLSRQILFYIPLLIILPRFFGIRGVFLAMPLADVGASILSAFVIARELRILNAMEKET
ncbi:MATE family efflux transporter [Treponema primitia]|uniref:MATE family efflux transporter n=1 Tax=Treponema primitia TaxID=88058 RepID=UPI0004746755|nr:MATE family efflux transporter [Treponema primitia]